MKAGELLSRRRGGVVSSRGDVMKIRRYKKKEEIQGFIKRFIKRKVEIVALRGVL